MNRAYTIVSVPLLACSMLLHGCAVQGGPEGGAGAHRAGSASHDSAPDEHIAKVQSESTAETDTNSSPERERVSAFLDGLETALQNVGAPSDETDRPAWADAAIAQTQRGSTDDDQTPEQTNTPQADQGQDTVVGHDTPLEPLDPDQQRPIVVGVERETELTIDEQYRRALDEVARLTELRAFEPATAETGYTTRVKLELLKALGWDGDTSSSTLTDHERTHAHQLADATTTLRSMLDGGALLPDEFHSLLLSVPGTPDADDNAQGVHISTFAACTRVTGFGVYRELPSDGSAYTLRAGKRNRMLLYTEVRGLRTRPAADRNLGGATGFSSDLVQRAELYFDGTDRLEPASDVLVWSSRDERIKDFSRTERQDFFTVQSIDLPATLSVGRYRLKLQLEDKVGGGVAEAVLNIEVSLR